jgi:hypothetical protein
VPTLPAGHAKPAGRTGATWVGGCMHVCERVWRRKGGGGGQPSHVLPTPPSEEEQVHTHTHMAKFFRNSQPRAPQPIMNVFEDCSLAWVKKEGVGVCRGVQGRLRGWSMGCGNVGRAIHMKGLGKEGSVGRHAPAPRPQTQTGSVGNGRAWWAWTQGPTTAPERRGTSSLRGGWGGGGKGEFSLLVAAARPPTVQPQVFATDGV